MGTCYSSGPNKAVIVSGGCQNDRRIIVGGWGWAWACLSHVQQLDLSMMTLEPTCTRIETKAGVPLTVAALAHVSFINDEHKLLDACEQFLDVDRADIEYRVNVILDGHLRAIVGGMSIEVLVQHVQNFAQLVKDAAQVDLDRMGMRIISFTIKHVSDEHNYIQSLGKTALAKVNSDTAIAVAVAEMEAAMYEAECDRQTHECIYDSRQRAAKAYNNALLQMATFDAQVNSSKAQANHAEYLQRALEQQELVRERLKVDLIQNMRQSEIEQREADTKCKELVCDVIRRADAQSYAIQTVAKGNHFLKIKLAEAECLADKIIAQAHADCLVMKAAAEARAIKHKAVVYRKYLKPIYDSLQSGVEEKQIGHTTEMVTGNEALLTQQITHPLSDKHIIEREEQENLIQLQYTNNSRIVAVL